LAVRPSQVALRAENFGPALGLLELSASRKAPNAQRSDLGMLGMFFSDTIKMEIGEYADDYGFPLPKPVSMHREYL